MEQTCVLTKAIRWGSVALASLMKKERRNFYHRLVQDVDVIIRGIYMHTGREYTRRFQWWGLESLKVYLESVINVFKCITSMDCPGYPYLLDYVTYQDNVASPWVCVRSGTHPPAQLLQDLPGDPRSAVEQIFLNHLYTSCLSTSTSVAVSLIDWSIDQLISWPEDYGTKFWLGTCGYAYILQLPYNNIYLIK